MDLETLLGAGLIAIVGIFAVIFILKHLGSRVGSSELPAPLGESIIRCDLEEGTPYHLFVEAENVPDRGIFRVKGRLRSPVGDEHSFSFSSDRYESWDWETEIEGMSGETERHQEKIGEFTPDASGSCEIVLDELEIEEAEYADKHAFYIWKPMVNI